MIIRLIADGEESPANDFHNDYWKRDRSLEQWRWEFVPRWSGSKQVPMVLALENDRIVGTQALIPIKLIDRRGIYWSGKSEETLVADEYRGQGLGPKMYDLVFDYARDNSLASIWGFTPATKALERSGFRVPCQTSQLIYPMLSSAVEKLLSGSGEDRSPAGKKQMWRGAGFAAKTYSALRSAVGTSNPKLAVQKGFEIRRLETAPGEAGEISRKFIDLYGGVTIYRDKEYLRWRIFDNPYQGSIMKGLYYQSQLAGWITYTMDAEGVGYLTDLLVAHDGMSQDQISSAVRLLLMDVIRSCRRMGAVAIRGWQVTNHSFDALVTRQATGIGFIRLARGNGMVLKEISDRSASEGEWYVSRIFTDGTNG